MFGLGMSEIILLSVMALIIIGPKQLPEVARTLGRFINELKRSTEGLKDELKKKALSDIEIEDYLKEKKISDETLAAQNHNHESQSKPEASVNSEKKDPKHGT